VYDVSNIRNQFHFLFSHHFYYALLCFVLFSLLCFLILIIVHFTSQTFIRLMCVSVMKNITGEVALLSCVRAVDA